MFLDFIHNTLSRMWGKTYNKWKKIKTFYTHEGFESIIVIIIIIIWKYPDALNLADFKVSLRCGATMQRFETCSSDSWVRFTVKVGVTSAFDCCHDHMKRSSGRRACTVWNCRSKLADCNNDGSTFIFMHRSLLFLECLILSLMHTSQTISVTMLNAKHYFIL